MAMFDVLVHPSYREGFGKVLQEAMGMKVPVITTNIPGPSEVIENNVSGILANVKDSSDLADKMLLLCNDSSLRSSFAEEGYKRAKTYFDRPIMLKNILLDVDAIVKK
jgi:glycosyltransferase involved in cell wall biosynthesis